MMGRRDFAPKLYYQLSLDRLVPADHLLRRIAEAMDFSLACLMACTLWLGHTTATLVNPQWTPLSFSRPSSLA